MFNSDEIQPTSINVHSPLCTRYINLFFSTMRLDGEWKVKPNLCWVFKLKTQLWRCYSTLGVKHYSYVDVKTDRKSDMARYMELKHEDRTLFE